MFVEFRDIEGNLCLINKELIGFSRVDYNKKAEGYIFELWLTGEDGQAIPSQVFESKEQAELALRALLSD